jgi:hypothetical protein
MESFFLTCKEIPALMIGSATWATALATKRQVDTTPTTGAKGRIVFTNFGKNLLVDIPIRIGAKTTCEMKETDVSDAPHEIEKYDIH